MEFDKKPKSRAYYFFDKLFRLFICNILTVASMAIPVALYIFLLIDLGGSGTQGEVTQQDMDTLMLLFGIATGSFLVMFPFTILPSIVASTSIIKDDTSGVNIFKAWFYEFKTYYVKSMLVGLIYACVFGILFFSVYFYSLLQQKELYDINIIDHFKITGTDILFIFTEKMQRNVLQAGFVVSGVFTIAIILLSVHIPMIIITLPKLSVIDTLKTNVFMTINYFVNTIILLAMLLVSIIGIMLFPIWIIFGISLPLLIGVRFSKVNYKELEKVDFDKINKLVDEDIENEEED